MGAAAQEMRLWTDRLEGQVDSLYLVGRWELQMVNEQRRNLRRPTI